MFANLAGIAASPELTALIEKVRTEQRPLTAKEIFEQQTSFVYGTIKVSESMTREDVRQMLRIHQGTAAI